MQRTQQGSLKKSKRNYLKITYLLSSLAIIFSLVAISNTYYTFYSSMAEEVVFAEEAWYISHPEGEQVWEGKIVANDPGQYHHSCCCA